MKKQMITISGLVLFAMASIASADCIKSPTLTCARGYEETRDADGCYECVVTVAPECITAPTLTCARGYHTVENAQGCFSCAKN